MATVLIVSLVLVTIPLYVPTVNGRWIAELVMCRLDCYEHVAGLNAGVSKQIKRCAVKESGNILTIVHIYLK